MRVNVIGTSGSGKSRFSRELSSILNVPYIEMDSVFWEKDWRMPDDPTFVARLQKAISGDSWVLDGNYSRTVPIKWRAVDYVIWLDFPFLRTLLQSIRRALSRVVTRQELWEGTGNRESWRRLFSKESIVLWSLKSYFPNRNRILSLIQSRDNAGIRFIRVRTQKQRNQVLRAFRETRERYLPAMREQETAPRQWRL